MHNMCVHNERQNEWLEARMHNISYRVAETLLARQRKPCFQSGTSEDTIRMVEFIPKEMA